MLPHPNIETLKYSNTTRYTVVNDLQTVMATLNLSEDDSADANDGSAAQEGRTSLRNRANRLHGVQNRAISKRKPTKIREIKTTETTQVKRLYLNEYKAFHSTSLETIFEQPEEGVSVSDTELDPKISKRKLQRRLVFASGIKASKPLQKKRRHRIEAFGLQKKFPKLKLEQLMEYLEENSVDQDSNKTVPNGSTEMV